MKKTFKNIHAAQTLLENYGKDSLSYFALHEKKLFFFSSTGQSFLSYIVKGSIVMVTGDPIGSVEEIPLLLKEFNSFIKCAKLSSCFLAVNQETLRNLVEIGHKHLHMGNEAIITLSNFNKNLLKKKVRRAERYVLSKGVTCRVYKRQNIPTKYLNQLQSISEEWLKVKGGKEKRLTMTLGRIPTEIDPDCEIVLGLQNQIIIGFLTFVPIYASKGFSLDAARKKKNSPNGLIEFLLIQSLEHFKNFGIKTISLNFTTFYQSTGNTSKYYTNRWITFIYRLLSHIYKTNTLYNFNNKFLPTWQERYFVFEKKRYLPNYLFVIAQTEL